nr:hypothetical protein [Pandoravirus aubagnensis]
MQAPHYALTRGSRTAPVTTTCAVVSTSAAPDWKSESPSYADLLKKCVRARQCAPFFSHFFLFHTFFYLKASVFSPLCCPKPVRSFADRMRLPLLLYCSFFWGCFCFSCFIARERTHMEKMHRHSRAKHCVSKCGPKRPDHAVRTTTST